VRNFAVWEKVIWVIAAARKNREGYRSVAEGRGRAEIFAEVAAVGPKRIQIRVKRLGFDVVRWVSPKSLYHEDRR
jgi:hypothetical protein